MVCDYRGTCVPRPPNGCRSHADCSVGNLCIEGYCRTRSETCEFDTQCRVGVCVNNECTLTCTRNVQCAAGDTCRGGFCRPANECVTSSTCDDGEHCVDGRCLLNCQAGEAVCSLESHCALEDQFCRPNWAPKPLCHEDTGCRFGTRCVSGLCRFECTTHEACQRIDTQLRFCLPEGGTSYCFTEREYSPECRTQADCGSDRDCVNGLCRERPST